MAPFYPSSVKKFKGKKEVNERAFILKTGCVAPGVVCIDVAFTDTHGCSGEM